MPSADEMNRGSVLMVPFKQKSGDSGATCGHAHESFVTQCTEGIRHSMPSARGGRPLRRPWHINELMHSKLR